MDSRLMEIVNKIKDEPLRVKVAQLLEKPEIEIDGKVYVGLPLDGSPAGISRHHSYPGGFVEHVVSATKIALTLCDIIEKVYHGEVNRDLVVSGVLLHDVFKPLTYVVKEDGTYGVSSLAERMDHLTLIVSELVRRGFPLSLIHVVCAHHGGRVGPIGPRTIEALVCHLADITDSQLNGEMLRAARYLIREVTSEELRGITSTEAFEIVRSKTAEGWDGVKKTIEKMRRND